MNRGPRVPAGVGIGWNLSKPALRRRAGDHRRARKNTTAAGRGVPGRSHVPAGISFRPVARPRIRGDGPGTLCVTVACLLKWLGGRQRARKVPAAESVRAVDRAPCHPNESMMPAIGEMLVALHLPKAGPLVHGD